MTCHSFLPALCCISFSLTVLAAALSFNTDFYGHSWYSEIQQMYFFSRHQHALSETAGLFRDISSLGLLEGFITQAASALSECVNEPVSDLLLLLASNPLCSHHSNQ